MHNLLDYPAIKTMVKKLCSQIKKKKKKYTGVYGIPRGGVPIATMISYELGIPQTLDPIEGCLIVDDIADSGRTLDQVIRGLSTISLDDNDTATLFVKTHSKFKPTFWVDLTDLWITFPWELKDQPAGEDNVTRILEVIGENPNREGLIDTPKRYMNAMRFWCSGYQRQPKDILNTTFSEGTCDEMVVLKDIEFYSLCEHHLAPFFGKAHIAYIPNDKVVGISKLARLVECFARRLQIQERLGTQIADSIMEYLNAKGCGVIIEACHLCMRSRGVEKQNSTMITSALRGSIKEDSKARAEFMSIMKGT